ncbi:MAG: flagellar protein FliS, partial [candidate division Zixibacteria bacterium]
RKMLVHLYTTLDEEKGGEVAENLGKLYTYLICQLDIVQATKDQSVIESSVKVLKNLREGWDGIATETQAGQTQQQDQTAANPTRGKLSISG